jgi:Fe-S oxidoreductase
MPGAAVLSERVAGFSARRSLPKWRGDWFRDLGRARPPAAGGQGAPDVLLFADTFNRYFEPENVEAALAVLEAGGYRVRMARPLKGSRPLCCGRTFLSVGAVAQARAEALRVLEGVEPYVRQGIPVVGLEPSCILSFRDEVPAMIPGEASARLAAQALTFEEFIARESKSGRMRLPLAPFAARALVHGHCHQKSFDAFAPVQQVLKLVPGLSVETIESSCCGMAGAFGYNKETIDVSLAMGELSLLPAVRKAPQDAIIVADGTSCRHQIHDGTGRAALHVARVLEMSLNPGAAT